MSDMQSGLLCVAVLTGSCGRSPGTESEGAETKDVPSSSSPGLWASALCLLGNNFF